MRTTRNRLGLESLEDRLAMNCAVGVVAGELIITGDAKPDTVRIADHGDGRVEGFATGFGAFSFAGITKIRVNTEGGSDVVSYNLLGDLKAGQKQYVVVGLGSDFDPAPDVFNAFLYGHDIKAGARLDILAGGGGGADVLNVNALNTDVAVGGALKTTISGDRGFDQIRQQYSGDNDGAVAFRSIGGLGNDVIWQVMQAKPGSTGQLAGWVRGEDGNDTLTLAMFTPPANPPVFAVLDGGAGIDMWMATANVTKINVP
jgi:hypothetical protein